MPVNDDIDVSRIELDSENYRLSEEMHGAAQGTIIGLLERDWELLVVGRSLVDNGYFLSEPLVIFPVRGRQEFICLEGNRRLAALKLILNPELRQYTATPSAWGRLETDMRRLQRDLSHVPVVVYESRAEAMSFLGIKHIAGTLKWDPLSKARYLNSLVESKGTQADFVQVAREAGSRKDTVRNFYVAYRILLQARDNFEIDTSRVERDFSVFYLSLRSATVLHFIGVDRDKAPTELHDPVPRAKAAALSELIGYIHGTREIAPVITDSRQLTMLGEVLESRAAYESLRANRNLLAAWQLTGGEERRLLDNLQRAQIFLQDSLRDVYKYKQSARVKEMVQQCNLVMNEITSHFPEARASR